MTGLLLALFSITDIVPVSTNGVDLETPLTFTPNVVCSLAPSVTLNITLGNPCTVKQSKVGGIKT